MRHLHKFHRIDHFKVRNLPEIERETITFYEYFGKYSIDEAEFFAGIFVFLLHILAKFFNFYYSRHIRRKSILADRIEY
jgi:hypothetical protein